jgi:hypothetical protein
VVESGGGCVVVLLLVLVLTGFCVVMLLEVERIEIVG